MRKVHKNRYKSNYKSGTVRKWAIALDVLHRRFKYRAISYQISKLSHTFFHNPQSIGQTKLGNGSKKKHSKKSKDLIYKDEQTRQPVDANQTEESRTGRDRGIIRFQGNKAFSTKHSGTPARISIEENCSVLVHANSITQCLLCPEIEIILNRCTLR